MKKVNIFYWILTVLLAAFMIFSGYTGVSSNPDGVKIIEQHLGYPHYFNVMLGVAKIVGGIALLIPGFPRLKEWIYAGFTFDMLAAIYSFIAVGDPASGWAPIVVFLLILAGSYILHHKRLKGSAA